MKMPAMQFYPADWRKDPAVQSLEYHDKGIWFEIMCLMHESSERGVLLLNGAPMPRTALARILGLDSETLEISLTKLITYGVAKVRDSDGAIYSKRMVNDEKLCKIRREAGKLGGNPNLLNQKPTTTLNQKPTPSSSSSSSSSDSIKEINKENLFEGVSDQVIKDFKTLRRNKKAAITQTAMKRIKSEALKAGITLEAALIECCERGWTGFKAEWYNKSPPTSQPARRQKFCSTELDYGMDGYGNKINGEGNGRIIDLN